MPVPHFDAVRPAFGDSAEELVEVGQLDPDGIHTPGIFVNAIFQGSNYVKKIEKLVVRQRA